MNFDQVLELIKTVSNSELTAFQYEEGNQKITMQLGGSWVATPANMQFAVGAEQTNLQEKMWNDAQSNELQGTMQTMHFAAAQSEKMQPIAASVATGNVVTSPLVGRFYVAPSEDAEPFVKVGDTVKKGQTLAIVEAMKLMNEIESDYDGVVTEILAENGQGVEYGQPLFCIS
uniref:acetyl-CoA carboxylase biotin carboxyl carrier protein n=1 Tax=Acetatifactor sp. TaxID=1872090 RepID=UPI00405617E2